MEWGHIEDWEALVVMLEKPVGVVSKKFAIQLENDEWWVCEVKGGVD